MGFVLNVILLKSTREFDFEFSYYSESDDNVQKGMVINVPFGRSNKAQKALVTEIISEKDYCGRLPVEKMKSIELIPDNSLCLDDKSINLAVWMRNRYMCSMSAAIKCIMPPASDSVKEKLVKTVKLTMEDNEIKKLIDSGSIKNISQINILNYLLDEGEKEVQTVLTSFQVSMARLNTLKKKGFVDFGERAAELSNHVPEIAEPSIAKPLTEEQLKAFNRISDKILRRNFSEVLLHGITGSGKTEVYLQLIQKVVEDSGQVIVLVPEIALTPQMTYLFRSRFGEKVAILHSRLTNRERFDQWQLIKKNKVDIVVGARSAVFAPFERLRLIVVDEEHEGSYKSDKNPRYHAVDVARERCKQFGAVLLLGSATPSIETAYRSKIGQISYIGLRSRASGGRLPDVELVDMKEELEAGNKSIFSRKLQLEIQKNLELGQQTILMLNRRGYSSSVVCRKCGYVPRCGNCNIAMTYHSSSNRIICHYCGYTELLSDSCKSCGSNDLDKMGYGTQKAEQDLKNMFNGISVIRMDADTTTGKNSHEKILSEFRNNRIDVLIGTQMIAKGHDFPLVTLVGILSADNGLYLNDFRASEKTFQLITQAAGRAGRGDIAGRVVVQGFNVDDYAIKSASNQDYAMFYKNEIILREQLWYPPFTNMAVVIVFGENDRHIFDIIKLLKIKAEGICAHSLSDNVDVLGPARCPMNKVNGKYRWRIIIKYGDINKLIEICNKIDDEFRSQRNKDAYCSIDINPVNML